VHVAAVVTGTAAVASAGVSLLTYWAVRRMNRGAGWTAVIDRRPPDAPHAQDVRTLVITRTLGPPAREVTVEVEPAEHIRVQGTGPMGAVELPPVLHVGGHIAIRILTPYSLYPSSVAVHWKGRFGRHRVWHSGL